MIESYFAYCNNTIFLVDDDIQIVVYSFNKKTSTYVGYINKKSNKSPSTLQLLKKYIPANGQALLISRGDTIGTM